MRPGGDLQAIGHFEVNYISENQGFEGRSEYLDGVVHRVRERGLSASVHFPSFNLSEVNRKIRAVIVQEFRDALEFARRLGAEYMVVHPGYLDYYETPKVLEPDFIVRMENDLEAAFEYGRGRGCNRSDRESAPAPVHHQERRGAARDAEAGFNAREGVRRFN